MDLYIPKKSGKGQKPLSIPLMKCRAIQALHLLALKPIVEERADPNAYGFRAKRSAHDAVEQCFKPLGKAKSATFVLEGDIRDCFGQISHDWLLENIPMGKKILRKFLKAGFMEKGHLNPTERGPPGLGDFTRSYGTNPGRVGGETPFPPPSRYQKERKKINDIAYADDFSVTATTAELLENEVMPKLVEVLKTVGLELSLEKTKSTSIENGFDFFGFNMRKYKNDRVLTKPAKANVKRFRKELRDLIKKGIALPTDQLSHALNHKITGWTPYYRSVVSSRVFSLVDHDIFQALKRWSFKRHPRKGKRWITNHYYRRYKSDN